MSNFLTDAIQSITIKPKRKIATFTAYVTMEEIATDTMEITQHPVQQGADITDHAYKKPAQLAIRAIWSDEDRSITDMYKDFLTLQWNHKSKPLTEVYKDLLNLQNSRIPFDVVTGKRAYKNMLLSGLLQSTDQQTENCLAISATLQEINLVSVKTSVVPAREVQKAPEKTGMTENAGTKSPQKSSFLSFAEGFGGLLTGGTTK